MILGLLVPNQFRDGVGIFEDNGRVGIRVIPCVPEVLLGSQFLN